MMASCPARAGRMFQNPGPALIVALARQILSWCRFSISVRKSASTDAIAHPVNGDGGAASGRPRDLLHRPGLLALFLGSLSMIGPFTIDTLFPAFPIIAAELAATDALMQQTISVYLIGFAVGSLLHGTLSDALGRKPVLVVCLTGFVLASIGCWLASSITSLLGFRLLQGFFAAAGTVISRALVRDRFHGAAAQKLTSQITLVFLFAPALAPLFGALILKAGPWRWIFGFITIYGAVVLLACILLLEETHPKANRQVFVPGQLIAQLFAQLWQSFKIILRDRTAVCLIAAAAFNFAGLFLYIASAPAIVFKLWQLKDIDMWKLFVFAMLGILLGSQLSGAMAHHWNATKTLAVGYALMFFGCVFGVAHGALAAPVWPMAAVPLVFYSFGSSLAYPSLTILLMDRFPTRRGAVASLQTSISLGLNALVSGAISPLVSFHAAGLAICQLVLMSLGYLAWRACMRSAVSHAIQPS